jgi:hypothetical protein
VDIELLSSPLQKEQNITLKNLLFSIKVQDNTAIYDIIFHHEQASLFISHIYEKFIEQQQLSQSNSNNTMITKMKKNYNLKNQNKKILFDISHNIDLQNYITQNFLKYIHEQIYHEFFIITFLANQFDDSTVSTRLRSSSSQEINKFVYLFFIFFIISYILAIILFRV